MKSATTQNSFCLYSLLLVALLVGAGPAWGQCTACGTTLTSSTTTYTAAAGEQICILANTTFSGTLNITQPNVTVCNSGTIVGTINVSGSGAGAVITNFGTISTGNIFLNAAATLTNGSASVPSAGWSGYLGGNITVAPTIVNYGNWTAQLQPLPGGTITNQSGATWNVYLTTSGNLTITNAGTWSSQIQEASNSPTISITHNGGSWTGGVGGGSGSLRITNNATWTQGFNFPGGGANAFTTGAGATSTFGGYLGLNGTVALVNNGTMNVNNGMAAISGASGLRNAAGSTFNITGDFTSQGTVANLGLIVGNGNFTNSGTMTGGASAALAGQFRFAGYTVNNGNFGADNSFLDFCDSTPPTPASNGFDARGGTIGPNVTFCAAPLPVTLTSFSAQRQEGTVLVQWTTASELNNKEFVVERSADAHNFKALETVPGHGTVPYASAYAVIDSQPLPGVSYYRLRQVDLDGSSTYSPVASVSRDASAVAAYPNPTADALTLDLRSLPPSPCQVRLLSLLGQLVLNQTLVGGQAQPLSLASLPAGTYLLEVASPAQGRQVQRIVKR